MKKQVLAVMLALIAVVTTGCHGVGEKAESLSVIYGAAAVISLMLLLACCALAGKKKGWLVTLFSSVLVVNLGYTLLSLSTSLDMALNANRIAYLGSVFLCPAMLMIILNTANIKHKPWLPAVLIAISAVMLLIAASPGILDIYYKEVWFEVVNGVATLKKVYGVLHPLYLVYLLAYFAAMVAVILRAWVKRKMDAPWHAVIVLIAVVVNLGVWLIEQLSSIDFEFLSVSYIISEMFLLGIHLVMQENRRLRTLVEQKDEELKRGEVQEVSPEALECFKRGVGTLTNAEKNIFDMYVSGSTTKDIMSKLLITENTLKYHNKNIYGKLGVRSRKRLLELYKSLEQRDE